MVSRQSKQRQGLFNVSRKSQEQPEKLGSIASNLSGRSGRSFLTGSKRGNQVPDPNTLYQAAKVLENYKKGQETNS